MCCWKGWSHLMCGVRTSIFLLTECVENSIETHFNTAKVTIFLFFFFSLPYSSATAQNFLRYFLFAPIKLRFDGPGDKRRFFYTGGSSTKQGSKLIRLSKCLFYFPSFFNWSVLER